MPKSDSFLRDAIHPETDQSKLTYMDGFRFGFGSFIAVLFGSLVVSAIALVAVKLFHLN